MERKLLRHLLNATPGSQTASYKILGKDLEEFNTEYNAEIDKKQNILGELSVKLKSYEVQSGVEPYYLEDDDPLTDFILDIADNRKVLEKVKTDYLEVRLWEETSANSGIFNAYKEDVYIEVTNKGGDTSGVQASFNIHHTGNITKGTYNTSTGTFSASASA